MLCAKEGPDGLRCDLPRHQGETEHAVRLANGAEVLWDYLKPATVTVDGLRFEWNYLQLSLATLDLARPDLGDRIASAMKLQPGVRRIVQLAARLGITVVHGGTRAFAPNAWHRRGGWPHLGDEDPRRADSRGSPDSCRRGVGCRAPTALERGPTWTETRAPSAGARIRP